MKSSNELNEVFWAVLSIKGDHTAAGRSWSPQSYISQWEEIYFEAYERKPHDHVFYFLPHLFISIYFCSLLFNQVIGISRPETVLLAN